jgi:acetyl esterase/lipase
MMRLIKQIRVMAALIYSAIRGRMAASKHAPETMTYATRESLPLKLDLYFPSDRGTAEAPLPLIIWFHGGGWILGSRKDIEKIVIDQLDRGFAVASVSYTLAETSDGTKTHWPVQCHEANAAVRFLRANAASLGLDPESFIAWGMSAGAHMAAMVGVTTGKPDLEGTLGDQTGVSSRVQAIVTYYPPTDFASVPRDFDGTLDYYDEASPVTKLLGATLDKASTEAELASVVQHVQSDSPPFFIVHGERDPIVPASQSRLLARRLRETGVPHTLNINETYTHGDFGFNKGRYADAVEAFLDEHSRSA